tara:strand:+ start:250 stop:567 length:318 start_codon:yes stop_codon:yes gene_type:complete
MEPLDLKFIRDDKSTPGAPLSLSRTILFLWFIFALGVGIISGVDLFLGDGILPKDISLFYDYVTYLSGIFVGGYGVGKGTQMIRRRRQERRRVIEDGTGEEEPSD